MAVALTCFILFLKMPSRTESFDVAPVKEKSYRSIVNIGKRILGGIDIYLSDTSNLPRINSLDFTTHEVIYVAAGKSSLMYPHVLRGQMALEGIQDSLVETEAIRVAKV